MLTSRRIAAGIALTTIAVAAGCGGSSGGSGSASKTINLVAYSTPQKAYESLFPAFQKTAEGAGTSLSPSYGASGTQEKAVEAGQKADVVEFSRSSDMDKLVSANLVPSSWSQNKYDGMVTNSVAVFIVRKGNPLNIHSWDDLIKPGVKVVTPNPLSSGSACWNLMAAYGAQIQEGKTQSQALDYVHQLLEHTVSQPESGSLATAAFVQGTGDVLIGYENEAIEAQQAGDDVDYVIPSDTILIQNPIAVTTNAANPTLANNFVKFLYSDTGQSIFAQQGYRPVVKSELDPKRFPTPPGLFTIQSLGGWTAVNAKFFDPENGLITNLENETGHGASG
ncbi:MAG TPA: sulfate ABC transporter substrate-binding protein [Mycobacteriales bacterium]|nr:sulfate ABC transporter substrate-binding protein [Mycobacteriales bacterium]